MMKSTRADNEKFFGAAVRIRAEVEMFCKILDCRIGDIAAYVPGGAGDSAPERPAEGNQ